MSMKRKDWSSPLTNYQEFAPQEFVAVCEDRDTWGATCVTMGSHNRGWIFYDNNMDGIPEGDDFITYDRSEHGGCGRTHYFHSPTRPEFNGWVLSESHLEGHNITYYCQQSAGGHYTLRPEWQERWEEILTPALIKRPGEVFDGNWLVCISLDDLRNPS